MTLGEPDGAGAGLAGVAGLAGGAEGVAARVLPGAGPAAGLAQPANPAVMTVRTTSQPRLPVIGPPPSPFRGALPKGSTAPPGGRRPGGALASQERGAPGQGPMPLSLS